MRFIRQARNFLKIIRQPYQHGPFSSGHFPVLGEKTVIIPAAIPKPTSVGIKTDQGQNHDVDLSHTKPCRPLRFGDTESVIVQRIPRSIEGKSQPTFRLNNRQAEFFSQCIQVKQKGGAIDLSIDGKIKRNDPSHKQGLEPLGMLRDGSAQTGNLLNAQRPTLPPDGISNLVL